MKTITLLNKRAPKPAQAQEIAPRFWETKTLKQMNEAEWEALCDKCGKCCVITIEAVDTGFIHRTNVSCKLFDTEKGMCGDYANRKKIVPDCVKLTTKNVPKLDWLPETCAYKLVDEKRPLYWWHPLVSGDPESVHVAEASARGRTRPEGRLQMSGLIRRIVAWPEPLEKPPKGYRPRRAKKG